jgi:ribonuclease D
MYIRTVDHLYRLCEQARTEGIIALDLEFIREHSYVPQLALIQVAVQDTCAMIDPLEIDHLKPLLGIVRSPEVVKVLHAAGQDAEVLFWYTRTPPTRVFDTQLAAAFVGLGEQLSYGRLVEKLIGVSLAKSESYSNWLQRPLSPEQVAYALDDVRYLLSLHEQLSKRLAQLGRTAWAEEEFRKFESSEQYQRDPRRLYQRIRRANSLASSSLSVLRELADWRDQEARRRNQPPGSVLRDEVLVEIARKAPTTLDDLQRLRGVPQRETLRSGSILIAMVQRGLAIPDAQQPHSHQKPRLRQTEELTVRFLDAYLRALCAREKLPVSRVASRTDLEHLVYYHRQGQLAASESPLLQGWRAELVGQKLIAVLEGHVSLHVNAETGELEESWRCHPGPPPCTHADSSSDPS